jgi:ATP-binding cassette subfamily B protein
MSARVRGLRAMLGLALAADRRLAVTLPLLVLFHTAGLVAVPVSLKLVVDAAARGDERAAVLGALLGAAALVSSLPFLSIAGAASLNLQQRIGALLDRRLMELSSQASTMDLFDRPEYLSRLKQLQENRFAISTVMVTVGGTLMFAFLLLVITVLLALQQPLLMVLPLVAVAPLWCATRAERLGHQAYEASAEQDRLERELFGLAVQPGSGKEVRVFGLGDELLDRHSAAAASVTRRRDSAALAAAGLRALGWLVFGIGYLVAVLVVVRSAARGDATPGDVILTIGLGLPIVFLAAEEARYLALLSQVGVAAEQYLWLQDTAAELSRPPADPRPVPRRLHRGIQLDDVGFRYPGTDQWALRGVTADLPAGSVVAVVGDNGAGKTTLVSLLTRLYVPTEGRVSVDGDDLASFDVEQWRARIGAGFQDFCQFELLARQTVGIGDVTRVDDPVAVEHALARAGGTDLGTTLPQGLDTQLGAAWAGGVDLSTGQWQKLALGRALMRETPLLVVLDEPTAALDPEAENALFERFADVARSADSGRITVLISHRFSTVRTADLILVLDGGRLVEQGDHAALVRAGGMYAELYDLQARGYR